MPHSSSGFGEVQVNRVYLQEKEDLKEDNAGKITISGQESSPPTTIAMVSYLHGQINALQEGLLVPVTWRDKNERDGFYTIEKADSALKNFQDEVSLADWNIDFKRQGSHTEVDLQSRLTGAARANDFSQSGARWHAPAINHYSYYTGANDVSTWTDRVGADGTIRVYRGIPSGVQPRWGVTPANYRLGRVRVLDTLEVATENEIEGINHQLSTTGWSVSNGLVNVTATASAGVIDVQSYSGGSYHSQQWSVQRTGVNLQAWQSVSVLYNTFEYCVIRLTANLVNAPGRITLDLGLRRGSRFVEGYLQSSSSATLKVVSTATMASSSGTGYVVKTSNDVSGNRPIVGSAHTFTADTTNGGLSKASTLFLDFYLGAVINATSPLTGDAATDIQDQYIGALPEATYAVRR